MFLKILQEPALPAPASSHPVLQGPWHSLSSVCLGARPSTTKMLSVLPLRRDAAGNRPPQGRSIPSMAGKCRGGSHLWEEQGGGGFQESLQLSRLSPLGARQHLPSASGHSLPGDGVIADTDS